MPRDGYVATAGTGRPARFDRVVELVNFAIAVVLVVAAWVLVVDLLALWDRHDHREHHRR